MEFQPPSSFLMGASRGDVAKSDVPCPDLSAIRLFQDCRPIQCDKNEICKRLIPESICVNERCQCNESFHFSPNDVRCYPNIQPLKHRNINICTCHLCIFSFTSFTFVVLVLAICFGYICKENLYERF